MRKQWLQLGGVTLVHLFADLFGGLLPAVLPVLRESYGLSLTMGVALMTVLGFAANGVQILIGHLRTERREPLFLSLGIVLASTLVLIAFVPQGPWAVPLFFLLMLVGGTGIAAVHPEGLRAIHTLDRLPSAVSTAFFMVGGFAGFSGGAFVAAILVAQWGLKGLAVLLLCPVMGLILIAVLRVQLAVEGAGGTAAAVSPQIPQLPFGHLLAMGTFVAMSSTVIPSLLPTYLYEQGQGLPFGGMSVLLFGVGGAVGSVFWGYVAHRRGYLQTLTLGLLLGVPLLAIYMFGSPRPGALVFLVLGGFCVYAAYPLIVTMARYALGLRLGQRLGLIVGGSWGIAGVVFLGLGAWADRVGVGPVLRYAWAGYLVTALYGAWLLLRLRRQAPPAFR